MKGELSTNEYCGRYSQPHQHCNIRFTNSCIVNGRYCEFYHRKHPTPEQFREEYGKGYSEDGAIYCNRYHEVDAHWFIARWGCAEDFYKLGEILVVCACTPWGKPPEDWRPE